MSEHATDHSAIQEQESNTPELELVSEEMYPDVLFNLPTKQFVQQKDSVIKVNDATRTTFVLKQLSDEFPELEYPLGTTREKRLQRVGSFLTQTVKIDNPAKASEPKNYKTPAKIEVRKRAYANEAVDDVLRELYETNHPTYQILVQIHEKFSEKLPEADLANLRHNVVAAAHEKELKAAITNRINEDR